jgi:hypothetical protein
MPLTTPNVHYFSTPSSNIGFMTDVVECLCGEHASVDSTTDWQVVDSWDGTTRSAPVSGDLADCVNAWAPGGSAPANGSWLVLQCQPGRGTNVCQVRFSISGTTPQIQLIPYADWTPGGGSGGAPTIPSRITSAQTMAITTGTEARAMVWDESMFAFMSLNVTDATQRQQYVGELDSRATEANDSNPFVHFSGTASWDSSNWVRYSPVDDTTQLTGGIVMIDATSPTNTTYPIGFFLSAVEVYFATASHQHFAGIARHIAIGPRSTANSRRTFGLNLGDRDWVAFRPSGNGYAMRHDGTVLDADEIRMRESYDISPPPGYDQIRRRPQLVRVR